MTTTPEDTRPEGPSTSAARRRPRRPGSTTPGGRRTRGRAPRPAGEDLVANLTEMVDRLIKENRELKRAIASAEKTVAGAGLAQATKMLSGLQRRVSQALSTGVPAARGRGRRAAAEAAPRPRRKVTDPEVLERRRQALAKARAARAAKRQAAGG